MIIDSHQHFWEVGRFNYPWMRSENKVLYRDYLPEELQPILRRNDVQSTVLVQASNSLAETRWLLELATQNSFIGGVVGWIDLRSPDVDTQLDEFVAHQKFKGVRHLVESEPDDRWLLQPAVLNGLKQLAALELTYDLLIHPRHLEFAERVVQQVPDLNFVIDHMAKPAIAKGEFESWSKRLQPFGRLENVYCKLSGLVTEANRDSWTIEDLRPFVEHALSVFGVDRLMFGSDHPVCLLAASYERVLEAFQEILRDLGDDERARVFNGNAARFYRIGNRRDAETARERRERL